MVIAMLLAHLVGDFILQWDKLAYWKSVSYAGVLVHCLIVTLCTLAFGLVTDPSWWPWLLFISAGHLAIDTFGFYKRPPIKPLYWFLIDQTAHMFFIFFALIASSMLTTMGLKLQMSQFFQGEHWMVWALAYAFLTMPAWVTLKFFTYGVVDGGAPKFVDGKRKYTAMGERMLIATLVLTGQFVLLPLIAIPRLILDWPMMRKRENRPIYFFEMVGSVVVAIGIGMALRLL